MIGPVFAQLDPDERPADPSPMLAAGSGLEFLQAVYRNSTLPLPVRMRAAIEALPFESPKLSATAFMPVRDFATLLEERMKRLKAVEAQGPKLIEGRANS